MTLALIQRWDQMGGKEWVSLLVLVVGIALVCYAVDWLIGYAGVPEPFRKVVRIIDGVGAIVEFLRGKDGMLHISELQWQRTEKVEDVVNLGDELKVKVVEFDPVEDRTRLSIKQLTERPAGMEFNDRPGSGPRRSGPPHRGGGGGFRGGGRGWPRR